MVQYDYDTWVNHKVYDAFNKSNEEIDFIGNIKPISNSCRICRDILNYGNYIISNKVTSKVLLAIITIYVRGSNMKYINITNQIKGSQIIVGCMRITKMTMQQLEFFIETALLNGINYFDHADIYGSGKSEEMFGQILAKHPEWRTKMIIQTKCGIRKNYYDFSKEHIIKSVENSLKRLNTNYIDVLLLHRPDSLVDPSEVNEAFNELYSRGLVKTFGVSNHNPMQIELLNKYLEHKIVINQLQLSITNCSIIDAGLNVNMMNDAAVNRDGSILDYCRLHDIVIQAWSPFQYGFFDGVFLENDQFKNLNQKVAALAKKYGVSTNAIVASWISRHPAGIQIVIGTTNVKRMLEICEFEKVYLTKEEWYALYLSVGKILP